MKEMIDLKKREKNVFRASFADGLLDILLGYFAIAFALTPMLADLGLGDFWSSMIWLPLHGLLIGLFWLLKKKVVIPRMGFVEYSPQRKAKTIKLSLLISAALTIGIITGLLFLKTGQSSRWLFPALLIWMIIIISVLAAYLLSMPRFFFYGFLNSAAVVIGELLFYKKSVSHHGIPLLFSITGIIMIAAGSFYLLRFIRKYPRLAVSEKTELNTHEQEEN